MEVSPGRQNCRAIELVRVQSERDPLHRAHDRVVNAGVCSKQGGLRQDRILSRVGGGKGNFLSQLQPEDENVKRG